MTESDVFKKVSLFSRYWRNKATASDSPNGKVVTKKEKDELVESLGFILPDFSHVRRKDEFLKIIGNLHVSGIRSDRLFTKKVGHAKTNSRFIVDPKTIDSPQKLILFFRQSLAEIRILADFLLKRRTHLSPELILGQFEEIQRRWLTLSSWLLAYKEIGLLKDPAVSKLAKDLDHRLDEMQPYFWSDLRFNEALSRVVSSAAHQESGKKWIDFLKFLQVVDPRNVSLLSFYLKKSDELDALQEEFKKNISLPGGIKSLTVRKRDWDSFSSGFEFSKDQNGKFLRLSYSDFHSVYRNSTSPDIRKIFFTAENQGLKSQEKVGYLKNIEIFRQISRVAHELARLRGYDSRADRLKKSTLLGGVEETILHLDQYFQISSQKVSYERDLLLSWKKEKEIGAKKLEPFDYSFYILKLSQKIGFDPESIQPYFEYYSTQERMLKLAEAFFGLRFEKVTSPAGWPVTVVTFKVIDSLSNRELGEISFDPFSRKGKEAPPGVVAHAFPLQPGVLGKQLPQAMLVTYFEENRSASNSKIFLGFEDVDTLFHEFAHTLNFIFRGGQRSVLASGQSPAQDFGEIPSIAFANLIGTPVGLQMISKHHLTGEKLPLELAEKSFAYENFGNAFNESKQLVRSVWWLKSQEVNPFQTDVWTLLPDVQKKYGFFGYLPNQEGELIRDPWIKSTTPQVYTHLFAQGYARVFSRAFWKECQSETKSKVKCDPSLSVAKLFRDLILTPGASRSGKEMIDQFMSKTGIDFWEEMKKSYEEEIALMKKHIPYGKKV